MVVMIAELAKTGRFLKPWAPVGLLLISPPRLVPMLGVVYRYLYWSRGQIKDSGLTQTNWSGAKAKPRGGFRFVFIYLDGKMCLQTLG
jgi:hypothetical protein